MSLTLETTQLSTCFVRAPYSLKLSAYGGTRPYAFSIAASSGSLPAGLSLVGDTITGTVTDDSLIHDSYAIRIEVRDATGALDVKDYSLLVRNGNETAYDHLLDPTLQDVIGPYQHTNASHYIMAKLFSRGISSSSYDAILNAIDILVQGWVGLPTSPHTAADTSLALVLEELRTWTNYLGAPVFENILSGGTTPGPGADEVTVVITQSSSIIYVGASAPLYDNYFFVTDTNDIPYLENAGALFQVKGVTPGTVDADGYTDTVSLILGYVPNPAATAPPAAPFTIVWHSKDELRELPTDSFARLTRMLLGVLKATKDQGISINGIYPGASGNIEFAPGLGNSGYNQDPYSALTLNSMSDGLVNSNLARGVNLGVRGGSWITTDPNRLQTSLVVNNTQVTKNISPLTSTIDINSSISIVPSLDEIVADKNLRGGWGDNQINDRMNSNYFAKRVADAYLTGTPPVWLTYPPQCRGDNELSVFIRSNTTTPYTDYSWFTQQWNWAGQPHFFGKPVTDVNRNGSWSAYPWWRQLEGTFTEDNYYGKVVNPDIIDPLIPIMYLAPIPLNHASTLTLNMYIDNGATTVPLATYTGLPAIWTYLVPYITISNSDESGAAGAAPIVITYGADQYVLNVDVLISSPALFSAAVSDGPVIFYLEDSTGVTGIPTQVWMQKDGAITPTSIAFTSSSLSDLGDFRRSGVSYIPGDHPAKVTLSSTGYDANSMALANGTCLMNYVDGPKFLETTYDGVGGGLVEVPGQNLPAASFIGSCGLINTATVVSADYDVLRFYRAGSLGASLSANSTSNIIHTAVTQDFPIYPTTSEQSHAYFIYGQQKIVSDEITELFLDEQYRLEPSSFSNYADFMGPIHPGQGTNTLYGWNSSADITDGQLQVCTDENLLVGNSYAAAVYGTSANYIDSAMFTPCLKIPQDDYSTIRTGTPVYFNNPDYSGFTATEYTYDRVFIIPKPLTSLSSVLITGAYAGAPNRGLQLSDLTTGIIKVEVKIPGPVGNAWLDVNAAASSSFSFMPDGVNSLGVGWEGITLTNNLFDGNYQLVLRITVYATAGALVGNNVRITSISIRP